VNGIDQARKAVRLRIDHAAAPAFARRQERDRVPLALHQPRAADHVPVQIEPYRQRQLARLVGWELHSPEGIPGQEVPVGLRVEAGVLAVEQPLAAQTQHLAPSQVERRLRPQHQRLAGGGVGRTGEHRPAGRNDGQRWPVGGQEQVDPADALCGQLLRPYAHPPRELAA